MKKIKKMSKKKRRSSRSLVALVLLIPTKARRNIKEEPISKLVV